MFVMVAVEVVVEVVRVILQKADLSKIIYFITKDYN